MEAPQFKYGDRVWYAESSSYCAVDVPCDICFGKLSVVLILGNGEETDIECEACGKGFQGPTGVRRTHEVRSSVTEGAITGFTKRSFEGGWRFEVDGSSRDHVFATQEEAEAKRSEMHERDTGARARMDEENLSGKKKNHAWSASYHRKHLEEAERKVAWHRAKLSKKGS